MAREEIPRRPPNLSEKVAVLTDQAFCACTSCRVKLAKMILVYGLMMPTRLSGRKVHYHHIDERANGGADHPDNYFAVTAECHKIETNGPNGSRAKIKKERKRARKAANRKSPKQSFPTRRTNWPSRKIPSRPFPSSKPM